ncbi:T9SS type A sorting domain-containing protein [Rurimicrobium arvi]|uniref:Secretion system C-terminal sorting domain-containing protein n=1 Tax=Rurimicrobium arvi TaxID=2049916 RepID=A0ABP8MZK8_9BACT
MKKLLLTTAALCTGSIAFAQTAADYAIQVEANVRVAPAQVTLNWKRISGASSYTIQKKAKGAPAWSILASTTDSFYIDNSVASDSAYEYKIFSLGGIASAFGYIYAGINNPATHNRGSLLILCDTLFRDSCATEVARLMQDLSGDGWSVMRHDVSRSVPDSVVKKMIRADYTARPDLKAVLILGHISVPYSGDLNPDGHADHLGAWPADVYYADMSGTWTDATINDAAAARPENQNIPGDGKWDQNNPPAPPVLQVSRIDFNKMPAFLKTEAGLMKSYLNKAHAYKTGTLTVSHKAVVDDNFGAFGGEAFAANAWRNYPVMIGRNNIISGDLITTMKDSAYQWSYGCGGGSYTSSSGIGVSADFAAKNFKGIFVMMFGSYFADWDVQNNFLRAPLCAPEPALTSCWAGRPNWYLHHMAMGENIGYSVLTTQTMGGSVYVPGGYMAQAVHVALMGDLSLRTDYIKPAGSLTITTVPDKGATISWTASPDPDVIGYYVYRTDSLYGTYTRLSHLLTGTSYRDTTGVNGLHYFMVRPCKLQANPSGTYYNLGLGISDTATVSYPKPAAINEIALRTPSMICFPNPANSILTVHVNTNGVRGTGRLQLSDINGRTVMSETVYADKEELSVSLNISSLSAAYYLLTLDIPGTKPAVQKIVRQ